MVGDALKMNTTLSQLCLRGEIHVVFVMEHSREENGVFSFEQITQLKMKGQKCLENC